MSEAWIAHIPVLAHLLVDPDFDLTGFLTSSSVKAAAENGVRILVGSDYRELGRTPMALHPFSGHYVVVEGQDAQIFVVKMAWQVERV